MSTDHATTDTDQDAEQLWERKLDDAACKLADDCTPARLADRFGAPDRATLDDVCGEAIQHVIADGRTEIEYRDFEHAYDVVQADQDDQEADEPFDVPADDTGQDDSNDIPSADEVSIPSSVDPDAPANTNGDNADGAPEHDDALDDADDGGDDDVGTEPSPSPTPGPNLDEVAFRKLVYGLAGYDGDTGTAATDDVTLLEAAREAVDRTASLEAEVDRLRNTADVLDERLGVVEEDVGAQQRGKRTKHAAVIQYADNARGSRPGQVVTPKEIAGNTGCSERHAYDVVEDMAEDYAFCELQTSPKAVRVSFEHHSLDELLTVVQGRPAEEE